MTQDTIAIERRLAAVEAGISALTQIVLSLVLASDDLVKGLPETTTNIAETQIRAAVDAGQGLAAVKLGMLIDEIRTSCGLTVPG